MRVKLFSLSGRLRKIISEVHRHAARRGENLYLVGGLVRDFYLGRENWDIDFAVEGQAVELARAVARQKNRRVVIYPEFGTATVEWAEGLSVDFAKTRKETYAFPGALPLVRPGSIGDDLFRRDFTINAMAVVLSSPEGGDLIDPFGGLRDLHLRSIAVLHEKSFIDDPTRILRAVRYEQRFGFHLQKKSLRLLRAALAQGAEKNVKRPRYFAEFRKLFSEPSPSRCLGRLQQWGGLDFLMDRFLFNGRAIKRAETRIKRFREAHPYYQSLDWSGVYLLLLLGKMPRGQKESLGRQIHLTRDEMKSLILLSSDFEGECAALAKAAASPSQSYAMLKKWPLALALYVLVTDSRKSLLDRVNHFLLKSQFVRLGISGEDAKRMGLPQSRRIGEILRKILLMKIDGGIKSARAERSALRQQLKQEVE